jgi:hypothetical protein
LLVAKFNIPKRYQAGVSEIRKLDVETASRIRAALDRVFANQKLEAATVVQPDDIATDAISAVPSQPTVNLKLIAEALAALYSVKSQADTPTEEFADDVCESLETLDSEELRLPHAERDRFRANLVTLLNADLFFLAAKAYDLKTDDERTFCHARILTDLRPVFGQEVGDGPKAMVVVHLLKLGYHQGSDKHQQFYVSLDGHELQELRKVIDRAEAKARTLKSAIKDTPLFGVPKE